jgi:hypothetical protein
LTAQLPFAAGGLGPNFTSWCLAVGSPVLVTFSLVITILNRNHVHKTYASLKQGLRDEHYLIRINAAEYLLSRGQQVPLHIRDAQAFRALVKLPENQPWWKGLQSRLKESQRGVSPAFVAQYALAVVSWTFTLSVALVHAMDGTVFATQLACTNLWVWLLPVVAGWLIADTQYSANGINDALEAKCAMPRTIDRAITQPVITVPQLTDEEHPVMTEMTEMEGHDATIEPDHARHDGSTSPEASPTVEVAPSVVLLEERMAPVADEGVSYAPQEAMCVSQAMSSAASSSWVEWLVAGDQRQIGYVFNYARVLTHAKLVDDIVAEFELVRPTQAGNPAVNAPLGNIKVYAPLTQTPKHVWPNMAVAFVAGLVVQWSTTGSSIIISYHTAPQGIGCFSMYYIMYAGLSSVIACILLLSTLLSHVAMLRRQDRCSGANATTPLQAFSLLEKAAIATRLTGKGIAITNALGLVIMSMLQLSNVGFSSCWCQAAVASWGNKGYVPIFRTPRELRDLSLKPWLGGVLMSVSTCGFLPILFWILARVKRVL